MTLNKLRENKKKFLTTMVIIIISATMVNYGIYSLLDFYFDTVETVYSGVQLNILFTCVIIGVTTLLMLAILPKKSVDDMLSDLSGEGKGKNGNGKTDEQVLHDMIEEGNNESDRKKLEED